MKTPTIDNGSKQSLAETAYRQIYRKIMTLEYEPGQRLEEKHLVEALGIGRTPVREALLRLAADFMVESQPNKGAIVRPITLQNTKAAFTALRDMEQGVVELAVRQDPGEYLEKMKEANNSVRSAIKNRDVLHLVEANSLFHEYLSKCSRNEYLILGLHKVRCETNRLAYLSFSNQIDPLKSLKQHYNSVVDQHLQIIECIRTRKEARLKKILYEHTQAFQSRIILYMAS